MRTFRRPFLFALLSLAFLLVFALPAQAQTCGQTFTLFAGQHLDAGTVTVTQSGSQLVVHYHVTGDWLITETHLQVSTSLSGVPATKQGNPKPGQFDYKSTYNPGVTDAFYTVPKPDVPPRTTIVIAAHAVVQSPTFGGQTAWSDGQDFPGANWFTYSEFRTCRDNRE